jgi:hypothetical protein
MRTRTIFVFLLAAYAVVSTVYFIAHVGIFQSGRLNSSLGNRSNNNTADLNLPVAPPFNGTNAAPLSGQDLLARVEIENELRYTDLQSFVCSEHMDRYKSHFNGENPHQIDTVNAQVSFENGVENYSGILENNHARTSMSDIPGAWSEGEFGTLLRQTRTLLTSQALSSQMTSDTNGVPAVLYSLSVSGEDSPWELAVANQKYRVPFKTDVLVAQATGRILRITRSSTAMPPDFGISGIEWSVNLKPVQMDGKEWLLPTSGEYSILYQKSNRREWNMINFSNYHHYTASSVMHF